MDAKTHWEKVYTTKAPDAVSWYRVHLGTSLGGGESTLVDDLVFGGYKNLTVLDVSRVAIEITKKRLGSASEQVRWLIGDILEIELETHAYDLWHDRAVFHFLTTPEQRRNYVQKVISAVKPGGHVIISTFGPDGPTKCSGLEVMRYDAESLHHEFGRHFRSLELEGIAPNTTWNHTTIPILLLPDRLASGGAAVIPRRTRMT